MLMKRLFDMFVTSICLISVSPLIVPVILLVRIKHGTPVFFKQQRPGHYGKPFYLYKFRSMTDGRDRQGNIRPDAMRLTAFGSLLRKYSLDELPQLWNVVKGDLSLVGPRPLLMEYLPLYLPEQARRHDVKPGITGWAQVNGRNAISWEEKFKLDVWYVDNHSFLFDIKILWMTVLKVVKREGISQQGHVTMEKFRGSE